MNVLGGFASAVALAVIALVMALESVTRMFQPQAILFNQAIAVAILGLVVNLIPRLSHVLVEVNPWIVYA